MSMGLNLWKEIRGGGNVPATMLFCESLNILVLRLNQVSQVQGRTMLETNHGDK